MYGGSKLKLEKVFQVSFDPSKKTGEREKR
jgi:hypothetical protein